jgi:hypothetical protein
VALGDHHEIGDARRLVRGDLQRERAHALGFERIAAGEHAIHQAAERVDVGAMIDVVRVDLLRRHEVQRAVDVALRRELLIAAAQSLRDAEVEDLRLFETVVAADEHDVRGLQIAMHDVQRVRRLQPARDMTRDAHRARHGKASLAQQPGEQRLALEELHHDVCLTAVGLTELQHLRDVSALDRRRGLRLDQEARDGLFRGGRIFVGQDHLDRDVALELRVARAPHHAHAALTKPLGQLVVSDALSRCDRLHGGKGSARKLVVADSRGPIVVACRVAHYPRIRLPSTDLFNASFTALERHDDTARAHRSRGRQRQSAPSSTARAAPFRLQRRTGI